MAQAQVERVTTGYTLLFTTGPLFVLAVETVEGYQQINGIIAMPV
jgi:hypothetical protein